MPSEPTISSKIYSCRWFLLSIEKGPFQSTKICLICILHAEVIRVQIFIGRGSKINMGVYCQVDQHFDNQFVPKVEAFIIDQVHLTVH